MSVSFISFPPLSPGAWRALRDHAAPNPPGVDDDVRATFANFVVGASTSKAPFVSLTLEGGLYENSRLKGALDRGIARIMRASIAYLMHAHRDHPKLAVDPGQLAEMKKALITLDDLLDTPIIDRLGAIA